MTGRLAACDPCRRAKLACGHETPTCARCRDRRQTTSCVYRDKPFKRKRLRPPSPSRSPDHEVTVRSTPTAVADAHRYPNPGFLGPSSHSAIFNQVSTFDLPENGNPHPRAATRVPTSPPQQRTPTDQSMVDRAVHSVKQLCGTDLQAIQSLVRHWLGQGVNLPLAWPFVRSCTEAMAQLESPASPQSEDWVARHANRLLENTLRPMTIHRHTTTGDFFSQMLGASLRWESVGIFFAAASRAAWDNPVFPPLYADEEQRQTLIKSLSAIGDGCLELCLAADCLNDLQLVLQYENFIVHSQVDGDQSYHSWRRMGDLSSSLFALGYHERIDENISNIPLFIAELRRALSARIFAADKSLAIFLGRPPRIVKSYFNFQLPANIPNLWGSGTRTSGHSGEADSVEDPSAINYTADTRCSASFASLKEEVLDLHRSRLRGGHVDKASAIELDIDKTWDQLPDNFKLETSVKNCRLGPFQRDFLVGTRLDYLQTRFLLGLVSLQRTSEPNEALLATAAEMLSLVVEAIILRDRLVNSGTSLIWKASPNPLHLSPYYPTCPTKFTQKRRTDRYQVAQYGLPAAGVISLALLNPTVCVGIESTSRSKMVQNLSVLVAEIQIGVLIQAGEPNFALFTRATRTIQSLLDSLLVSRFPIAPPNQPSNIGVALPEQWDPFNTLDVWEFEHGFWAYLAEHPTLLQQEN